MENRDVSSHPPLTPPAVEATSFGRGGTSISSRISAGSTTLGPSDDTMTTSEEDEQLHPNSTTMSHGDGDPGQAPTPSTSGSESAPIASVFTANLEHTKDIDTDMDKPSDQASLERAEQLPLKSTTIPVGAGSPGKATAPPTSGSQSDPIALTRRGSNKTSAENMEVEVEQIVPPMPAAKPLPIMSYAAATKVTRNAEAKKSQSTIRGRTEGRIQDSIPQYFSLYKDGATAVIIYENTGVRAERLQLELNKLTKAVCILDNFTYGVTYLNFAYRKDFDEFMEKPIVIKGKRLRVEEAVFSEGARILIRAEKMYQPRMDLFRTEIQHIYRDIGVINYINPHYIVGSGQTLTGTVDFILEVPTRNFKGLTLPRMAAINGRNTLFTWPKGGILCYRCGGNDHVKAKCHESANYNLAEEEALVSPVMVKAFPDTLASPTKINKTDNTSAKDNKQQIAVTPLSNSEVQWTVVGQKGLTKTTKGKAQTAKPRDNNDNREKVQIDFGKIHSYQLDPPMYGSSPSGSGSNTGGQRLQLLPVGEKRPPIGLPSTRNQERPRIAKPLTAKGKPTNSFSSKATVPVKASRESESVKGKGKEDTEIHPTKAKRARVEYSGPETEDTPDTDVQMSTNQTKQGDTEKKMIVEEEEEDEDL